MLSGVDVHACHLAAVTDAHLHLHGAVSALAGDVDNHTCVRGVQLVDALRGSLLFLGGRAGENAAELQILRPVVLSRGIDEIPDKVARLVDAAAHRAGGNGGAGDGIHIIPHLRRNGQARELVGKRRLLGFRAQAGGFREFRAAHTDAGDGALQIHAYMDFHRAAKAGDGHLCHIADLAAVLHRRVAAVYGASLRKRNFLKGIRPGEAGIAGSIGCLQCSLGDRTLGNAVDNAQHAAHCNADDSKSEPRRNAKFQEKPPLLPFITVTNKI